MIKIIQGLMLRCVYLQNIGMVTKWFQEQYLERLNPQTVKIPSNNRQAFPRHSRNYSSFAHEVVL